VSRALRDSPLVTENTREKIRKIAQEQGYRFNISARNLRMRRSYSVAVVVEMTPVKGRPMSDPYPLELLGGITQELTTAGYSQAFNVGDGFEGDVDEQGHRGNRNGWKAANLPWRQS